MAASNGIVTIEEHREVSVGIATACGLSAAFADPTAELRGLNDDA